jgi:hypothetical protein
MTWVRSRPAQIDPPPPFLPLTLVVLFLVSQSNSLFARRLHPIFSNCGAEVQKFSSSAGHDTEAIKQCLLSQQDKLSAGYKAILPKH